MVSTAMYLFLISVLSKILGMIRDICLTYYFGTSYIVDAYFISVSIPMLLFALTTSGFSNSYIPFYIRGSQRDLKNFLNNLLCVLFFFTIGISVIAFCFRQEIIYFISPGINEKTFLLVMCFSSMTIFVLPILTIFSLLIAHSQANNKFIVCNLCNPIVLTCIIIAAIMMSSADAPHGLIYGHILAYIISTMILWAYLRYNKLLSFCFFVNLFDKDIKDLCKLAIPLGMSVLANNINTSIDNIFASLSGEGVISALAYSNKIQLLLYSFSTAIFMHICYPRINRGFAENKYDFAMYYIYKAVDIAIFISVPIMCILFIFAEPIVKMLFERGMFSSQSTEITSICLQMYSIGIIFYSLREITTMVLAANIKQKLIFKNTVITVVFNIYFNYYFLELWGYRGIALATSIAGMVAFLLMEYDLRKLNLSIIKAGCISEYLIICIIALIAGKFSYFVYVYGSDLAFPYSVIAAIAAYVLVYLILSMIFKVEIFTWCIGKIYFIVK